MGWKTDEGFARPERVIIEVEEAEFLHGSDIFGDEAAPETADALFLRIEGHCTDEDGETYTESGVDNFIYKCGKGWDTPDRGKSAEHPSRENFVKTAKMGKLVNSLIENVGVEVIAKWGEPNEAATYEGKSLVLVEVVEDYVIKGKEVSSSTYVVEALGKAKAKTRTKTATKAAASPRGLKAKVKAHAAEFDGEFGDWEDAVFEAFPALEDNEELIEELEEIFEAAHG